jgi:O-antigen/teichoic acid export membrane protein
MPADSPTESGLGRQGAWAVADQVLSSGTNFVPALVLARVLGPGGFGAFSLAFVAWFGALAVVRSALMQPYTLVASALHGEQWRATTRRAAGAVVAGGVVLLVVFAVAASIVGVSSAIGRALLVVAILAPGLALQEFWRVAAFSARRARTAFANDGVWALGQVAAFAVVATTTPTPASCMFAWGIGAWIAATAGIWQLSVLPQPGSGALRWARDRARIGAWFTAVSVVFALGSFGVAVIVAATTGTVGVGLFRTVQNLFGPVQLLVIGAESVYLPHLVRVLDRANESGIDTSIRYSTLMSVSVLGYGALLLFAAHELLGRVFGDAFAAGSALVLPLSIAFTLDAVAMGAVAQLRARAAGGRLFMSQAAATTVKLVAVGAFVGVAGLDGAAWGVVIGSAVGAIAMWTQVALVLSGATEGAARRRSVAYAFGTMEAE